MNTRRIPRVFLISLLVLGTTCSSASPSHSPSQTVRTYWSNFEKGDAEANLNLCSKRFLSAYPEVGVSQVKEGFKTFSKYINDRGGIRSIEIQKEDILRDTAEVTAMVKRGDQGYWEISYKLVKEDGAWKIDETRMH